MGDQHNHRSGRSSGITTHRDELLAVVSGSGSFIPVHLARTASQARLDKNELAVDPVVGSSPSGKLGTTVSWP